MKWKKLERVHKCITGSYLFELESDRLLQDGMFKQHEEQLQEKTVNCRVPYDVKYHQSHCISHAKMSMSWIWASYNSSVHHCGHCLLHDPTMAAIAEKGPEVCTWSLNQNRSFLGLPGVWKELGTGVAVNLVEIGKTVGKNVLQFTPFSSFADENLSGWLFQWLTDRESVIPVGVWLPFAPFPPCFW